MSGFRQSQGLLHTWSGLVVGWVLYTIFLAGTIAYWREDMNRWMRPELGAPVSSEAAVAGAVNFLGRNASGAASWSIYPDATGAKVYWQPKGKSEDRRRRDNQALVGADGERVHARETKGGEFFYRFHFDLYYVPVIWSRWFVGFCAMMMLVAILSGIITHKKIFKDFFTFRRGKGQRTWLDGHNATAVLALPFHLMITYTGLVTFLTLYMPWAALANYQSDRDYRNALSPSAPRVECGEAAADLVDLRPLIRNARARWNGSAIGSVKIEHPSDAAAQVTIVPADTASISTRHPSVTYSGVTGKVIWEDAGPTAAANVYGVLIGLHTGRFAPDLVRWLYFLSGITGTIMVAGGLVMWTVKRREKVRKSGQQHLGFSIVERLNIGFIAGLPLGMTGFLWANRLLPIEMARRADWEVHSMFLVWGAALVVAFLRPGKSAWSALLASCGGLLVALPLYDLSGARSIITAIATSDSRMASVSVVVFVIGCAFLAMAYKVSRYRPPAPARARRPRKQFPAVVSAAE